MMVALTPKKQWWTTAEIAEGALPDLPQARQNVEAYAKRNNWRDHPEFSRRRQARGGGWEYSWELFPMRARQRLLRDAVPVAAEPSPDTSNRQDTHTYFEGLPELVKAKARDRLRIIQMVLALECVGTTKFLSVAQIASQEGISERTIWNWFAMIDMVPEPDWLPYLAPRHRAAVRSDPQTECSPDFIDLLKADYLRLERPSFSSCYRRCVRIADAKGWTYLPDRTARRRFNEMVPQVTQTFAREGYVGLSRKFPPQTRDRSDMVAMEGVNADCHKFDVFVMWPNETKPSRAQIVCFQDIYSGKILSWRVDHNPNKVAVMAAFGDLIDDYGIPQHCLFDNGREFANKWLTGGAKTRFRFKIRDEDPLGVLTLLGIKIHWATPAHGQAKPIERAFRDFADDIAKDPRFSGAYVGNKPDAKPENYGSKAIPIDVFIHVVGEGVREHNARIGRRADTAAGRSFDETFAESYAVAPIRKATDEQRRLWLMGQEVMTLHHSHGRLSLQQNKYWSAWMNEFAGQKVVARFDPEDLHAGVYIYALDGSFMGFAECEEKVGFFDMTGAKDHARKTSAIKRIERKLLEAHQTMDAADIAAELNSLHSDDAAEPEAKVVRPVFAKRVLPPSIEEPQHSAEEKAAHVAFVAQFQDAKSKKKESDQDEPHVRFKWALKIEAEQRAGKPVSNDDIRRLSHYQNGAEYQGLMAMYQTFGETMFG